MVERVHVYNKGKYILSQVLFEKFVKLLSNGQKDCPDVFLKIKRFDSHALFLQQMTVVQRCKKGRTLISFAIFALDSFFSLACLLISCTNRYFHLIVFSLRGRGPASCPTLGVSHFTKLCTTLLFGHGERHITQPYCCIIFRSLFLQFLHI